MLDSLIAILHILKELKDSHKRLETAILISSAMSLFVMYELCSEPSLIILSVPKPIMYWLSISLLIGIGILLHVLAWVSLKHKKLLDSIKAKQKSTDTALYISKQMEKYRNKK